MRPLSARSLAARLRTRTQSRLLGSSAHAVQPSRQQVSSSQLTDCRALHASAPARDASPTGGSSALSKAAVTSPSQELLRVITSHIKAHGPLPLPRYISFCLYHPTLGYYTRSDRSPARIGDKTGNSTGDAVIGAKGDFVTSPEISQVFGELLAIWYISQWQAQGMPKRTRIVELGPGRGTLMEDMLRTFRSIRAFGQTLTDVHLVETSPYMRKLQEDKLAASCRAQTIKLHWHDRIQDVPLAPSSSPGEDGGRSDPAFTMVVAHEFFDALPIHMFEKRATGFREVFVDIDAAAAAASSSSRIYTGNAERDAAEAPAHKLRLVVSQAETLASRLLVNTHDPRYAGFTSEGVRIEVCPEAYEVAQYSAELVSDPGGAGGAGLVVDYGDDKVFNNSFRAFKNHQLADPLAEPGQADLTANVDFAFLREALTTKRALPLYSQLSTASSGPLPPLAAASTPLVAPSAATPGGLSAGTSPSNIFVPPLLSQRSFLLSLGLQQRVQRLVDAAPSDERKQAIIDGAQRLVDKTAKIHGMGKIFKVLGFVPREQGSAPQPSEAGLAHQSPSQSKEVFPFGSELD